MNTYEITLARAETRILTFKVQATSTSEANNIAHEMLGDADFHDGRAVHAEGWVQEVSLSQS